MKALLIIGTRPEAIKMAPVYQLLRECSWCTPSILLTGQHSEMARSVLELFEIVPDFDLNVMRPDQTLVGLTARLTQTLARVISSEIPDVILVQGDTASALIGGWLGFYAGCRVGHVEAGLRTGNLFAPYPEEFNRRVLALAAHWHFAPTRGAAANLRSEGVTENVHIVGNTVIDAALEMANRRTPKMLALSARLPFLSDSARKTVLVTTHRRENFGEPLHEIATAVVELSVAFPEADFVLPIHPNPLVAKVLRPALESRVNVHLIQPLEYDEMIALLRQAFFVMTDSGGIQEEAPAFDVPVLVLRNETERMEGVEAGCSVLVGTCCANIVLAATRLFSDPVLHASMAKARNPYGNGTSARQIIEIMRLSVETC